MNGYNFTDRVRAVLAMAREESARLHHEYVGTEHILLGLLREGEGVGATALINLGVSSGAVAERLESTVKKGHAGQLTGPDRPYTSRAKKVPELSMSAARDLTHSYVGTEHLLLGLLAEQKGIAAQVLRDVGMTVEKVEAEVVRILGTDPRPRPAPRSQSGMGGRLWSLFGPARANPSVPLDDAPTFRVIPGLSEAMIAALALARDRGCDCVDATHLMLAILGSRRGRAVSALRLLGADIDQISAAVDSIAPRRSSSPGRTDSMTLDVPLVTAWVTAAQLRWRPLAATFDSGDIVLGLLDAHPPLAALFAERGLDPQRIRDTLDAMEG